VELLKSLGCRDVSPPLLLLVGARTDLMAKRKPKSTGKKPAKAEATTTNTKESDRPEAEVRAESFRVAAYRETIEAFVVAFILALLFRAFLAEAFVIPTGSMAPALMGAHKDLVCDACELPFQVGASRERNATDMMTTVVAGTCPNCRHLNTLDLAGNGNHATFNGDRIVVSKYSYIFNDPERWDVIVFKYPGNPKQNYIKRLVGLPNEVLTLKHGDVYARPLDSDQADQILRKPPDKLLAMRHLVYDTGYQSPVLIAAEYPARWQPWQAEAESPPSDSWKLQRTVDGLTAALESDQNDRIHWLRYFHRWPSDEQWELAEEGGSLAGVDPYQSRLITDFYAYDSYVQVPASLVYEEPPSQRPSRGGSRLGRLFSGSSGGYSAGRFRPSYQSGGPIEQFGRNTQWGGQDRYGQQLGRDGLHWVGDLIVEADVETGQTARQLILKLVEAGVEYRCAIDLQSGMATLTIDAGGKLQLFDSPAESPMLQPAARTSVLAGRRNQFRFSNCDDQLLLWIDDELVEFDSPTTFRTRSFRGDPQNRPHFSKTDPADAAPVAIGLQGGSGTIHQLRIDRDKYYVATQNANFGIFDYDLSKLRTSAQRDVSLRDIQDTFAKPGDYADSGIWQARRTVSFKLEQDQFFPMGDNSPESLDARCWAGSKMQHPMPRGVNQDAWRWANDSFVRRSLLVGKALVVFWPHAWNDPVPFTPNFRRMKLIR